MGGLSNALGPLCDDAGTATTASNALGALSNHRTATTASKALGALAVDLADIRASQHRTAIGPDKAARDDHAMRERRKTFLLVSLSFESVALVMTKIFDFRTTRAVTSEVTLAGSRFHRSPLAARCAAHRSRDRASPFQSTRILIDSPSASNR